MRGMAAGLSGGGDRARQGVQPKRAADLGRFGLQWLGFTVLALAIFAPALRGQFVSDDLGYIVTNPYVHALSLENLLAILDPRGEPALYTANWAPLHLLAHAVEWSLWGPDTTGYHLVNVLLHALAAALLVALFTQRGFSSLPSLLAGLAFLVHPANVEAVAWIFQLKTIAALALATGALLAHPRHPLLGAFLFALALLSKAAALFALPVAVAFAWTARDPQDDWRVHWRWLALWALIFVLYSLPQFFAFERVGQVSGFYPDAWAQMRSMVAIGARYLVMAATSYGVAAFHEPARVLSWLDPWWLAGLAAGALLALRCAMALLQRREEAAWWVWAAASYAPISQLFPFLYPMADRYLYTILPGLLGAAMLVARELWTRLEPDLRPRLRGLDAVAPVWIAAAAAVALVLVFGPRSYERARVWRSPTTLELDSIRHYPDGISANMSRAAQAAQRGDARQAADAARRAYQLGFHRFMHFYEAPVFAAVRDDPIFQVLVVEMAGRWIEETRRMPSPTQADLRVRAHAHIVRGELAEAKALLEQALRLGGGFEAAVRAELAQVSSALRRESSGAGDSR
jgi:hypothetical protein